MSTLLERTAERVQSMFPTILYEQPFAKDLPDGTILGTYAYSLRGKVRWITKRDAEIIPGVLPGDLARQWVRENYALPIRRRKDQNRSYVLPLRAIRGKYVAGAYVDISKAYRRVLELVGYDVDYRIGKYLSATPIQLAEEFYLYKPLYQQCVAISATYLSTIPTIKNGEVVTRRVRNVFHNPCLYAFASEMLACYVGEVVNNFRCAYANTDGVIVDVRDADGVIQLASDYQCTAKIDAQGHTEVWGVGSYVVGERRSKRQDANPSTVFQTALPSKELAKWMRVRLEWADKLDKVEGSKLINVG